MSWTSHIFFCLCCTSSMFQLHPPSLFLFAKRGCRCVLLPLTNNVQHYGKVQCNMVIELPTVFICMPSDLKEKQNSWIDHDCGGAFRLLDFFFEINHFFIAFTSINIMCIFIYLTEHLPSKRARYWKTLCVAWLRPVLSCIQTYLFLEIHVHLALAMETGGLDLPE